MPTIYLIRHGQASIGSDDYDRLSRIGERQSAILGGHLKQHVPSFDAMCVGTLRRQQRTAALVRSALGDGLPDLQVDDAFNEYDHQALIEAYLPHFIEHSPYAEEIDADSFDAAALVRDARLTERALRHILRQWMANTPHEGPATESWTEYCRRVEAGLDRAMATVGPAARVAVFTSGGVIAAILRTVLGLSNKRTMALGWSVYNGSVTQLYYGRSAAHTEALMLGFNSITHLEVTGDRDLVTFR